MAGRPTRPETALIAKRRTDALQLRMAGVDYLSIGKKLAADPRINSTQVAYPCGYGREAYESGERPPSETKLAELAKNDVYRAMERRRTRLGEAADDLRNLQDERLNRLLTSFWTQAMQGDGNALDRVLKIMERQAKLQGLDAPTRTEVSGTEGGAPILIGNAAEADRAAAMQSVLSFRADKAESIEALKAIEGTTGVDDEDVAAGYGAGLDDDEDDEDDVDAPIPAVDADPAALTLGEGDGQ